MRLTPKYYAQAWWSALQAVPNSQWPAISRATLQHLYQHGHVKWLPEIVRIVAELEHHHNQTTAVTVRLAHPLPDSTVLTIVKRYLPNIAPVIHQIVDTALIGGVQIETDNLRYNTSVKSQLNQLAHYVSN